jgi:hypothetical protein
VEKGGSQPFSLANAVIQGDFFEEWHPQKWQQIFGHPRDRDDCDDGTAAAVVALAAEDGNIYMSCHLVRF